MATTADVLTGTGLRPDRLSGAARETALDRWIYVFTALAFIAVALAGFLPDSANKIALVQSGQRAPFPLVLHMHAVLMGSFLMLLLAQTTLAATGRLQLHRRLGLAGMVLAPALVVVGFVLAPTMYHLAWNAAQAAPPAARAALQHGVHGMENTLLLQLRAGVLFALLIFIGLRARASDPGLHKRLMMLAVAPTLGAGFARITWLPTTLPVSATSLDIAILALVTPMFLWDLVRNRTVHRAYWVFLAAMGLVTVGVHLAWDKPWWHAAARQVMGV